MEKEKEDLLKEWGQHQNDLMIMKEEILPKVNEIKAGTLDKYFVVLVPSFFEFETVELYEENGEKRAKVNLKYKGLRFANTFPIDKKAERIIVNVV